MGSDKKVPKTLIRSPNTWGLKAASRVNQLINQTYGRLGFDPRKPWYLISLETFYGEMGDLAKFAQTMQRILDGLDNKNSKCHVWLWPMPKETEVTPSKNLNGSLRVISLPKGVERPDDLIRLELVDVHSQIMGRVGFEFLRLHELLSMWRFAVEQKQFLAAASMSRNIIEATASLFQLVKSVSDQWTKCKLITGTMWGDSSGGQINCVQAMEVDELRRIVWNGRNELLLNDSGKIEGFVESLTEWRHPDLSADLAKFNISIRSELTAKVENPTKLVRELSKSIILANASATLIHDYELLCNIVHPSLGSFQLFSSTPLAHFSYGWSLTKVGLGTGSPRIKSRNPLFDGNISPNGIFANSISEAMFIASNIELTVLSWLVAIGDDISLTAGVESVTNYKTWRYPKVLTDIECLCTWNELGGCDHSWGVEGPQIPQNFKFDLSLKLKR